MVINTRYIVFNTRILWFMSLLLWGCCQESDQLLDPNIRKWAPYENKEELTFINENQDTVVFKVSQYTFMLTGYDKVCGNYNIETLQTKLINQTDTAFQLRVELSQQVLVTLESFYQQPPTKNVSALFNSISEQYISNDWRDQYIKEINLNGKMYGNVLHIYGNAIPNPVSFTEIYYAPDVGLVAFRNEFGMFYLK